MPSFHLWKRRGEDENEVLIAYRVPPCGTKVKKKTKSSSTSEILLVKSMVEMKL
jgi:hypothetical protein